MKRFAVCLFALFIIAQSLVMQRMLAQVNGTTTVALTGNDPAGDPLVLPSFKAISVIAPFAGDANGTNSALVEYRVTGSSNWSQAYAPYTDRRATVGTTGSNGSGSAIANPWVNMARVSIVGLTPNTSYDVRVTWSDPDGVSGTNPVSTTVTTLSYNPPTASGTTYTANNDADVASHLNPGCTSACLTNGDVLHLNPGTYAPFTINRGGISGAWVLVEGDSGGGTNIQGAGSAQLTIGANFVIAQQFTFPDAPQSGIVISSSVNHAFVQTNALQKVASSVDGTVGAGNTTCVGDSSGSAYGYVGINIGSSTKNIYVLNNTVVASSTLDNCTTSPHVYNSPGTGIGWTSGVTLVIENNTVKGSFRDGISSDSSANVANKNVDVDGNTVGDQNGSSGYKDDGVEHKGQSINVRLWNNHVIANGPRAATLFAPNTDTSSAANAPGYGPIHFFRNTGVVMATNNASSGQTAYKLGGTPIYIFNNSVDTSATTTGGNPGRWDGYVGGNMVQAAYNNIWKGGGNSIVMGDTTALFDYNLYRNTKGGIQFSKFCSGCSAIAGYAPGAIYTDFNLWKSGTKVNGQISTFTVSGAATGAASQSNLSQDTTSGSGTGALFNVTESGGSYVVTTSSSRGSGYAAGNTVTILGSRVGGGADLVITITAIANAPGLDQNSVCGNVSNQACPTDPAFTDSILLTIGPSSPAAAKGVYLANFTDPPWGTTANQPSIGAVEANPGNCTVDHMVIAQQPADAALNASIGTIRVSFVTAAGAVCPTATNSASLQKHTGATWGNLNGTSPQVASGGSATFADYTIGTTAGVGAIDIVSSGLPTLTTNAITIAAPCSPSKLAFTSQPPNDAITGQSVGGITVAIQDVNGNQCSADTRVVTITIHTGSCLGMTLNGTTSGAAAGGQFFSGDINMTGATGQCQFDAAASMLTGTTSNPFNVVNTPGAHRARLGLKGHP